MQSGDANSLNKSITSMQLNDVKSFLSVIGPINCEVFDLRESLQATLAKFQHMEHANIALQEEVNNLKSFQSSSVNQIEELKNSLNAMSLANEELSQANSELEQNFNTVSYENSELKIQIEEAQSFLSIIGPLNGEIFDLRGNLQASLDKVCKIKDDNRSLKYDVQRLTSELNKLQIKYNERENEFEAIIKSKDDTLIQSQANQNIPEESQKAKDKVDELKSEISRLYNDLSNFKSMDSNSESLEKDKNEMLADIGILEENIYELNRKNENSIKTINELRNDIIDKLNLIDELKNELANSDKNVSKLIEESNRYRKQSDNLKKKLLSLNNAYDDLELQLSKVKHNNEQLQMKNEELTNQIDRNAKEIGFMNKQIDQHKEFGGAIQNLRSKLVETETSNTQYEQELKLLKEENKNLTKLLENSKIDSMTIRRLEDEKLELTSRVALLEGQLQLQSVKMKDAEICQLENKIAELQKSAQNEKVLSEKVNALEIENESLRAERDANELKNAELEANTISLEEYNIAKATISTLKNQIFNNNREIENLRIEKNSIDLKHEERISELNKNIMDLRKQLEETEDLNNELSFKLEEIQRKLDNAELDLTSKDTANIKDKKNAVRLTTKISELETINSSLQNEKNSLEGQIEELHKYYKDEIQKLSNSILRVNIPIRKNSTQSINYNESESEPELDGNDSGNSNGNIQIVSFLNKQVVDLNQKLKNVESKFRNEAASHIQTKRELAAAINGTVNDLESQLRSAETKYKGLEGALTKIFDCEPSFYSIITAAGNAKYLASLSEKLKLRLNEMNIELVESRRTPNLLKQQLKESQILLDQEKKKVTLLENKLNNSQINSNRSNETNKNAVFESNIISFINSLNIKLIPMKTNPFIHDILNHTNEIESSNYLNEQEWSQLSISIINAIQQLQNDTIENSLYEIQQKFLIHYDSLALELDKRYFDISNQISRISDKIKSESILKTNVNTISNSQITQNLTINNQNHEHQLSKQITPNNISFFQESIKERETPRSSFTNTNSTNRNFASTTKSIGITPTSALKSTKKTMCFQSPFRTPLGNIDNSINNRTFDDDTPDYRLPINKSSKLPVRNIAFGVSCPKSRNFH